MSGLATLLAGLSACASGEEGACVGVDCGEHGRCVEISLGAYCDCDDGFVARGADCVEAPAGDADTDVDVDVDTDVDADTDSDTVCPDGDGDGHADLACGGDDCDDVRTEVHPGAIDNPDSDRWTREVVDASGGYHASLAVGDDGTLHLAYVAVVDRAGTIVAELRYRTKPVAGDWSDAEVVDEAAAGLGSSFLALGDDGAHISYYRTASLDQWHATNASGVWETELVASGYDYWGAPLAFDAGGFLHIVIGGVPLRHATNASGAWATETIDPGGGEYGSVAIDGTDTIHVTYRGAGMAHAWNDGGGWQTETVDPAPSSWTSIRCDADDVLHVAYSDEYYGWLRYAHGTTGAWTIDPVAEGDTLSRSSLALDADGIARVAYQSGLDGETSVRYAVLGESDPETVELTIYDGPSLAIGGDGLAHVSYVHSGDYALVVASSAAWDGVDQNCDEVDGVDADGDGHASVRTGGDDCDDEDAAVFAGCP